MILVNLLSRRSIRLLKKRDVISFIYISTYSQRHYNWMVITFLSSKFLIHNTEKLHDAFYLIKQVAFITIITIDSGIQLSIMEQIFKFQMLHKMI